MIPIHDPNDNNRTRIPPERIQPSDPVRVIMVVEGINDIEFLRRISRILWECDQTLPHLVEMEQLGELIFPPFGGGSVMNFTHRFAPLHRPEYHLYDHELPPETDLRREAAKQVNCRPLCRAMLTGKRSLENYLHPEAILAAGEMQVAFDDFDPVAEIVAKRLYQSRSEETRWERLSSRTRKRMAYRAKIWLNTDVVEHMTPELLLQRDPQREVLSWLRTIGQLADLC